MEEKSAVAAQMRAVSQTLRETQNRCHWLENQVQGQAQVNHSECAQYGSTLCLSIVLMRFLFAIKAETSNSGFWSWPLYICCTWLVILGEIYTYCTCELCHHHQGSVHAEVAPGAPQERSNDLIIAETAEAAQLRERWAPTSVWCSPVSLCSTGWVHGYVHMFCVSACVCVCVFRLLEVEQSLADERARRETVEEALRLAEDRAKRWDPSVCLPIWHIKHIWAGQNVFIYLCCAVWAPVCPETVRGISASTWRQRRSGRLSVWTQTSPW